MNSFDLEFEIITPLEETNLINSIQEILDVKDVKLNNPLINDYISKVFNDKITYNELLLPEFTQSQLSSLDIEKTNSPKKRPDTPIVKTTLHNTDDNTQPNENKIELIKEINSDSSGDSIDCNLSCKHSDIDTDIDTDIDSDSDSDMSMSSINSESSITMLLNNKKKKEDNNKLFNKHSYILTTRHKLEKLNNITKQFDDTNNIICDLDLNINTSISSQTQTQTQTFIKISPLVEPIHYIKHFLPFDTQHNYFIPCVNTNTLVKKINSKYNSCYIEALMGYLLNKMVETNTCIGYPRFYGCFTGIQENIHFDISEDYDDIKHKSWFKNKQKSNLFIKKTIYEDESSDEEDEEVDEEVNEEVEEVEVDEEVDEEVEEVDEEVDEEVNEEEEKNQKQIEDILDLQNLDLLSDDLDIDITPEELEFNLSLGSDKSLSLKSNQSTTSTYSIKSDNSYTIDNISECSDIDFRDKIDVVEFPLFPINACIMEKIEFTLDELCDDMDYEMCEDEWISVLFQIVFNLMVAQKHYKMCHNDLHSSNIMFEKTDI